MAMPAWRPRSPWAAAAPPARLPERLPTARASSSLTKTGTGTLGLTGNVSLAGTLNTGGGALAQTAGSVQAPTVVVDGGTYNLSGNGKLSWSGNLIVGNSGTGTFNQSSGTNSSPAGVLDLGNSAGATGTYNLSGLALLSVQDEGVGVVGQGSFVQTGGTNSSAIFISNSGSYAISGGLLQNTGAGATFVLDNLFQQSGGTVNVSSNGFLLLSTSAAYSLSGSGQLSSKSELIGLGGNGVFTQSGGTNSVTGVSFGYPGLILGYNSGDSGTYSLDGGLLNVVGLSAGSARPRSILGAELLVLFFLSLLR